MSLRESACRVCFQEIGRGGTTLNTSKARAMLLYCFPSAIQHAECPVKICRRCLKQLALSYKLKKTFRKTEKKLKKFLKNVESCAPDTAIRKEIYNVDDDDDSNLSHNDDDNQHHDRVDESVHRDDALRSEDLGTPDAEITNYDIIHRGDDSAPHADTMFDLGDDAPLAAHSRIQKKKKSKKDGIKNKHSKKADTASSSRVKHCASCPFETTERAAWLEHLKVHPYMRFLCAYCAKGFKNRFALDVHSRRHTEEKPFRCTTCAHGFTQKHSLLVHERALHRKEKPYACHLCHVRFPRKEGLAIHERTHTGLKPFECAVCGKRFGQPSHLATHRKLHTGEKPFACRECSFRTAYSSALRKHTRGHTGERNYACSVCPKTFRDNTSLCRHRRIHTGELPYKCAHCDRAFIDSWKRSQHVARSHAHLPHLQ